MDDAMAPPLKRRKLASSAEGDIAYLDDTTPPTDDSAPSYSHAVESIHPPSSLAPPRTDDEEDVGQEPQHGQQHAPVEGIQHFEVIVPRQDLPSPTLPSVSSAFFTYGPSPTITFPIITSASIPAATIPAGVTPSADTGSGSDSSISSSSSSSLSSSTSESSTTSRYINNGTSLTSSLASSQPIVAAISTSSANSTISAASETSTSTTLHSNTTITTTSTDTILFLATLSDGDVTTITRHSGAFTTTLLDGELVTIPGLATARTSSETSTSTPDESSLTSIPATITPSPTYDPAGSNAPAYSSAAPTTTAASSVSGNNNDSTPPAGTIAGGVVGGAAGLAVVVLIAMLFVRWYRRKANGQHRALPAGLGDSPEHDGTSGPGGPGMAERAGLMPLMSAVPAFFRHQNRSTADSSERGFTRVSGRKLPSAFSEGMSSEAMGSSQQQQPTMPLTAAGAGAGLDRNLSNDSLYRESYTYAGTASPTSPTSPASPISQSSSVPIRNSVQGIMTMAPGPQRQPQVHSGGPYTVPPGAEIVPGSPRTVSAATFSRSDTPSSLRNSRFTEDM